MACVQFPKYVYDLKQKLTGMALTGFLCTSHHPLLGILGMRCIACMPKLSNKVLESHLKCKQGVKKSIFQLLFWYIGVTNNPWNGTHIIATCLSAFIILYIGRKACVQFPKYIY